MTLARQHGKTAGLVGALAFVLVAAAAGPASGTSPHGTSLAVAGRALERWDLAAARDALSLHPAGQDPALEWTRGVLEFYEGDYAAALAHMERAEPDLVPGSDWKGMISVVRSSLRMSTALQTYESEHFVVRLDPERDWVLAAAALETLEKAYDALGGWLGHYPYEKVRVEIVPSAREFEEVSSLTVRDIRVSGAIGICKFNKIMLLSPRLLLRGFRWRDSLVHEYIHYLLVSLSANGAPIWLQEGVARYGETLWRSDPPLFFTRADEGLLAEAVAGGTLISFGEMHPSLVRLPSMTHVRLAFAESALAVEYLLSRWGVEGLQKFLAGLAGGSGVSLVMEETLGMGLLRFEEEWRAYLRGKTLRPLKGLQVRELRLSAEGGDGEEWELEHWQSLEGKRHVKLGDLLRSRQRREPALREYAKALEAAPAAPLVHNRMAMTLIELGRLDEAERHLREAVAVHPDYAASYGRLAAVRAAAGDWNGAEAALREYLDINPFDPFVWRDLGELLLNGGRQEEGEEALATAGRLARTGR